MSIRAFPYGWIPMFHIKLEKNVQLPKKTAEDLFLFELSLLS